MMWDSSETMRSPRSSFRVDIVQVRKYSLIFNSRLDCYARSSRHSVTHGYTVITRPYSNFSNKQPANQDNIQNLKAVSVYDSLKENRVNVLKEQRDKSGVYCLINKVNGHTYVGSSINLASRMRNYLNNTFLKSKQNVNMPIVRALLKYDQSNFTLLILEYVEPKSLTVKETLTLGDISNLDGFLFS
nr:GIY-YIG endonuclease [Monilinia laxa]QOE17409.1 GIY-YIG endonuclease [Monilinia laxa]QYB19843.1 GIY-YIG endonuclease [Monilinia laxa]QYB19928.1 GIY-YIG endonuclease [Monilinia laxa]QYB20106.1 GIY-YIG endonuclease [Monilinia laxa]QYB20172.1 GIY-YIG endonuclease [Monilinia laxa]